MSLRISLILILSLLLSLQAESKELYNRHISVRALGMGNAYIGVARNLESMFYNPAGLAKTDGYHLTLAKAQVGLNSPELIFDVKDFRESESFEKILRKFYGKPLNVNGAGYSGVVLHGIGLAAYDSFNVSADLSNPALPNFDLDYVNDMGFAAGFGIDLIPEFVSIGVVGKRIQRLGSSQEVSMDTIASLKTDELKDLLDKRGLGYSLDVGANITFPSPIKPRLSFVMRDVGDTKFSLTKGTEAPPTDPAEMLAGVSFEIDIPGVTIIPAIDYRYIGSSEVHVGKKINGGLELQLPFFDVRGGFHQGYWTAGASMSLGFMKIDAASYGVELGEYAGQHEDRRYIIEFSFEFGWDGNDKKGSAFGVDRDMRRKLKQRR